MINKKEIKHKGKNGSSVENLLVWMEGRILFLAVIFVIISIWHPWANIGFTVTILVSYAVSFRLLRIREVLTKMAVFLGIGAYALAVIYALLRLFSPGNPWLTVLGAVVPAAFVLFGMKRNASPIKGVITWLATLNAGAGLAEAFLEFSWISPLRVGLLLALLASYVWITRVSCVYAKLRTVLNKRSRVHSLSGDGERTLLDLGVVKIVNHTDRSVEKSIGNVSDEDER